MATNPLRVRSDGCPGVGPGAPEANKVQVKAAVEHLFKVKVAKVRTVTQTGKLRRRGRFSGYRADWKKAYVRLKAGEKMPEYAEI